MVQIFGNTANLQGGAANIQGSVSPIQGGYNPQQVFNPITPQPVVPKPVAPKAVAPKSVSAPKPVAPAPVAQPVQINPLYAPFVQTRASKVNPSVLEYYNPQNSMGFSNQQDVFNYLLTMTGKQFTDLKQLEGAPVQNAIGNGLGSVQIDPYQNLAQQAGAAGLSYEDYLKIAGSQNGVTQSDRNTIRSGLGIDTLENQIYSTPSISTEKLYTDAYGMAGLSDLKAKIAAKTQEINDIQSKYTDKAGQINENPFLSEASRVGRARILDDKRLQEIGNLNNELGSMQELYNSGINEINNLVTRKTADFSNNQQANIAKLNYLLGKAEEQIGVKQNEKLSEAYRYLPAYLQAKAKSQKPETIGSNETGYYAWNPSTGTFSQVIAPQVTPNYQANPLTGELFNTKDGSSIGSGNTIASLAQAVLQNPSAYSQLTTAQQGAVNNYFAQNGQPIPTQLTPEQKNKIASIGTLQQTISAIETLGGQLNWQGVGGLFQGSISQFLAKNFGTGSQQEQMLRSYISNLQATIAKERGGTSFTANEQALLEQYTPTINDSPQVIQSKLAALKSYFGGQVQGLSGGGSQNDPLGIRFNSAGNASASTPYLKTLGQVTGANGSSIWSYGLDVDLKKGDPVKSPVNGVVIAAKPNGGFGNQVKIRTNDGEEIWLSHLDTGTVKVGQVVNAGQLIGYGGNTGNTIAIGGGDGSHLDITIKGANGKLYTAPQVKSYLDTKYV